MDHQRILCTNGVVVSIDARHHLAIVVIVGSVADPSSHQCVGGSSASVVSAGVTGGDCGDRLFQWAVDLGRSRRVSGDRSGVVHACFESECQSSNLSVSDNRPYFHLVALTRVICFGQRVMLEMLQSTSRWGPMFGHAL